MKLFFATLQFMSRIPVPQHWTDGFEFKESYKGIIYFPWVGLILGALAAFVTHIAADYLQLGNGVSAVIYVLMMAILTGGLHLDGLADTCDGIFSARTRERMLEIMKDSRIGTHGTLALIFGLLLKVVVVAKLLQMSPHAGYATLIIAPVVSRALMSVLMYEQEYARENGLGNIFIGKISGQAYLITLLTSFILLFFAVGGMAFAVFILSYLFSLLYRYYINHSLGGQTGDTLGAGNELFEIIVLLCAASMIA
ncbi:adenosylcobinamide-GDP ribazoletransferase [Vibrio porteresiae]|uniref:Adenosylcobinamide-GDP ribazoletransferase n=1 Tax=Vibrio porteresiae DSM 19223 TaxID=1123496 RepID=A0ABZ0QHB9_9VIBR|nr:adenosylcobinamide-GDP ribazoletransferase [Vibrio porteresiae]WPC75898.1 adenosylcobinamide-GDP ribazoletransferase [Vibrio porteresiae DSM 19223]